MLVPGIPRFPETPPRAPVIHSFISICVSPFYIRQHIWHKSRCPALQHRFCAIFVSNTLRRNFQNTKRLHIQDMFYVQQFSFHFSHIFCHREYFLASCISSHCKLCTNAQKKCVCVHFLRCRICAFVFCDSFSILHVFPYNFVVTVLQHIQIRTNFLNLCKIFPQSLLDTGLSYFSIMHKSFCLSSYVLT